MSHDWHRVELRNEGDNPAGYHTSVYLDGKPLYCREVYVAVTPDALNTVTVVLDAIVHVDLPANVTVLETLQRASDD